jgi:chaperonin GroEL (HSP60 family)
LFISNAEKFRSDLMNIAMTTLSSKILSQDKEYFANFAVDAVMRLKVPPKCQVNFISHHFFKDANLMVCFFICDRAALIWRLSKF